MSVVVRWECAVDLSILRSIQPDGGEVCSRPGEPRVGFGFERGGPRHARGGPHRTSLSLCFLVSSGPAVWCISPSVSRRLWEEPDGAESASTRVSAGCAREIVCLWWCFWRRSATGSSYPGVLFMWVLRCPVCREFCAGLQWAVFRPDLLRPSRAREPGSLSWGGVPHIAPVSAVLSGGGNSSECARGASGPCPAVAPDRDARSTRPGHPAGHGVLCIGCGSFGSHAVPPGFVRRSAAGYRVIGFGQVANGFSGGQSISRVPVGAVRLWSAVPSFVAVW